MIQKATPPPKTPLGRPPAFETDTVINGAVQLFWSHGFEGTSLQDIAETLGVRSSTLYNSFGGKDGLYQSAAEAYLETADVRMFAPLRDGQAGLDDLIELLERQRASVTSTKQPAGCLIINAMITGDNPELTKRYSDQFRHAIDCALERAVKRGEIDAASSNTAGAALFSGILGANVIAKRGATPAELNAIIDGLIATINDHNRLP